MNRRTMAIASAFLVFALLSIAVAMLVRNQRHRPPVDLLDISQAHTTLQLPVAEYRDSHASVEATIHRHLRVVAGLGQSFEADVDRVSAIHNGDEIEMLELTLENSSREATYQQALALGKCLVCHGWTDYRFGTPANGLTKPCLLAGSESRCQKPKSKFASQATLRSLGLSS